MNAAPVASSTPAGHLWRLLRSERRVFVPALLCAIGAAAVGVAEPLAVRGVLDAVGGDLPLAGPLALLLGLFVADALLIGAATYLLGRGAEATVLRLRVTLVGHVLRLSMRELDRLKLGDVLSRLGSDTVLVRSMVSDHLANTIVGLLELVAAIALMAWLDWLLLVTVLACIVVFGGAAAVVALRIRSASAASQEGIGLMTAQAERALGAMRTVKASRAEDREAETIGTEARSAYRAGLHVARLQSLVYPIGLAAFHGSFLVVLGLGGARVASGEASVGDLIAFLLYLFFVLPPVVAIFVAVGELQKGLAGVGRAQDLLGATLEEEDASALDDRDELRCVAARDEVLLELDGVEFAYDAQQPVLRGVSFSVPPTGVTAIVGPSGAGKTTLLALIERFYDVHAGSIRLDGVDLRALTRDELRGIVGYVEQESPVLAGTLRENLRYARPSATQAELGRAIEATGLAPVLERLPQGLESDVGERGSRLSGGERQRVAIARALVGGPRLLLLDEPTSQLDAVTEQALRLTIEQAAETGAVVVVAHRLSTVRAAAQIVVLADGEVVGIGSHEELVRTVPLYRRLVESQLVDSTTERA